MFGYALWSIRCLLILVLALATVGKVSDAAARREFAHALESGLRLPHARLLVDLWVAAEAITALLLALPPSVELAAVLACCEFGCLTVGVALLVAQRRAVRCSCFGGGGGVLGRRTVLRNSLLTLAALLLAVGLRRPGAVAPAPVVLAAILSVLTVSVLAWQAGPLRALLASLSTRPVAGSAPTGPVAGSAPTWPVTGSAPVKAGRR